MHIAMWSGPRNLSTAMMYAFGARQDFAIWDEPFYAAWLHASGARHPMRAEVIEAGESDPAKVVARCAGPVPSGRAHFYQKHMIHHMIDSFPRDWMTTCKHVFLIRHPARVVASYLAKREKPGPDELGFDRQLTLHDEIAELTGQPPLVVDAADIRSAPDAMLRRLCDALGIPFCDAMLHWPEGGHPDDGIWAAHWYGAVHRSRGFAGPENPLPALPNDAAEIAAQGMPAFDRLAGRKLMPAPSGKL